MADYWIKLYHDILDDPKMAVLPDNLWRRIIELFLFAGKLYKDGNLPDTKQIAWCLRRNENELEMELKQIVSTGIIIKSETGWFIPKFKFRQDPMTNTERVRKFRETKQHEQYNANETIMEQKVTQITDNRLQITDTDTESPTTKNNYLYYEQEIGLITPTIADFIDLYEKELSPEYVHDAIYEAVKHSGRTMAYVKKVLDTWKKNGKKENPQRLNTVNQEPKREPHVLDNGDYERDDQGRVILFEVKE
jgi:DnaD/phage-associated family protein